MSPLEQLLTSTYLIALMHTYHASLKLLLSFAKTHRLLSWFILSDISNGTQNNPQQAKDFTHLEYSL